MVLVVEVLVLKFLTFLYTEICPAYIDLRFPFCRLALKPCTPWSIKKIRNSIQIFDWNYSEWKERQVLCSLLTVHLPTRFLGEAFPLWAWPFFRRQERNIFTLRNRGLENNYLKVTLLKSFGEEVHPLQVYFAWQIPSSTLLSCEWRRARNYQVLLQKKVKYRFFTLQMEFTLALGLFSYWILPQTAFLMQQQEKIVGRGMLCWN